MTTITAPMPAKLRREMKRREALLDAACNTACLDLQIPIMRLREITAAGKAALAAGGDDAAVFQATRAKAVEIAA